MADIAEGTGDSRGVDRKSAEDGRGGWKWANFLLVNQGLASLAFFGMGDNLVLFLTRVLGQDDATAANNVSNWTGVVYLFSLVSAFLSDSYLGRYKTCTIFQLVFILGMVLLSVSSGAFLINPSDCGDGEIQCSPASRIGVAMFSVSMYLIAFGYGGHQPAIATFGADQFDEDDPRERASKGTFFGYFYFALNLGSLFSDTVLVYFENSGRWTLGFLVSTCCAVIALLSFWSGTMRYRYVKPSGNPFTRVAQVFAATVRKWDVVPANEDDLYELKGSESAIKGSRKIRHSDEFRCLDKAATVTAEDKEFQLSDSWRLCTVTQVEEVKCILKMLPVWLCTIMYSVVFTQMASLFIVQGDAMITRLGHFHIPAASMTTFNIFSVLLFTGIYSPILVPLVGRLINNRKPPSELQRMGIGLVIGILAMVAAATTEILRLCHLKPGASTSTLSILWQVPQYVLVGASEVFMYVGQLEFFNGQAPDGIKSLGSSLSMASISLGNYVSSMLVSTVTRITAQDNGGRGWIPDKLHEGHLDRFFFLIAGLASVDFVIYLVCARWCKPIKIEDDDETKIIREDEEINKHEIQLGV